MTIAEMNLDYELDCELFEEDADSEVLEQFHDPFLIEEICNLAKKCLEKYFDGKFSYDGNQINLKDLDNPKFIDLMIKSNIISAVDRAYDIIKKNEFCSTEEGGKTIAEDVVYIVNLIHKIQKSVPQDFVGGVLLIHLNLVEGLNLD